MRRYIVKMRLRMRQPRVDWTWCNGIAKMKDPYAFGWNVMDAAVAQNRMEVMQYLDNVLGNRCTRKGLERPALNGYLEVVKWLNNSRYYKIRTFRSLENAIAGDTCMLSGM